MTFDALVLISRLQPPHKGYVDALARAMALTQYVIVVCGDAAGSLSITRPWSLASRREILFDSFDDAQREKLIFLPVCDNRYHPHAWSLKVRQSVLGACHSLIGGNPQSAIGLLDYGDDDLEVLKPHLDEWPLQSIDPVSLAAKHDVRSALLAHANGLDEALFAYFVPSAIDSVRKTLESADFANLREEFGANLEFRRQWQAAPWPPVFVTVDALVCAGDYVLLIQRGRRPGKGLWALPGGFLDQDESLFDACLRELLEETAIQYPLNSLRQAMSQQEIFDEPNRSARGRTITHAFRFDIETESLPHVQGADDAAAAKWIHRSEIRRDELFEDHYAILQVMLDLD